MVDNGSTDSSADIVSRQCPDTHVIRNPINLGFAGGTNKGIVQALAEEDAPILLLNNDAFVAERDVIRLLDTLSGDKRIGCIGPLLFDAEQQDKLLSAGGRNPVLHHHGHILKLPVDETVSFVEYVPGTVIIVRADVFHAVGLLDEEYFFGVEVADLCMRAGKQGYLSAIDARARATHTLGRSSHLRETLHTYYIIRNRFLFIPKFHRNLKFLLYGVWALYSVALSLKVYLEGKPAMAQAVHLGLRDGLQGRFGGQNERVLAACAKSVDRLPSPR